MAQYNNMRLTAAGKKLLSEVYSNNGAVIKFTKVASGSGTYLSEEDFSSLTELKNKKQEFSISAVNAVNRENVQLDILMYNYGLTEGYYITEIGLYAYDPLLSREILYAVITAKEGHSDYFPAHSEIRTATIALKLIISVADSEKVTVVVNEELFVPYKVYTEKVAELERRIQYGIENAGNAYELPVATDKTLGGILANSIGKSQDDLLIGVDKGGLAYAENPIRDLGIGVGTDNKTLFLLYKGKQIGAGVEINGGAGNDSTVPPSEEKPDSGEQTEYTPMESITSMFSNAFIDSGVMFDYEKTTLELEFEIVNDGSYVFMQANDNKAYRMRCELSNSHNLAMSIGSYGAISYKPVSKGTKQKLKIDRLKVYLNNNYMADLGAGSQTGTTSETILFGNYIKIYSMKIWNDSVLVRDLIPVRDTLGELAMYDLVNKKYHKCAGTGKFV